MPTAWPSRSRAEGDALLIAAQSGRALAAAARRAGLRPFVADLFGDEDTLALSEGHRRVPGALGSGLHAGRVLAALDALAAEAGVAPLGVVLGSGFEAAPDLIAAIARRFRLLGAPAPAVAALKDPFLFAALAGRVGAPHPPVTRGPVPDPADWLDKRRGGSGGGHIRPAQGAPGRGRYLQRRVAGQPRSVAFLADGRTARMLAVTEQWSAPGPGAPFRYAGSVEAGAGEASPLPPAVLAALARALEGLVAATELCGLASADCLVQGEAWWLLEVNPRPGATLDILDRRATPLLLRHIEASLGRLAPGDPAPPGAAAQAILYADRPIRMPAGVDWPDWVADRPAPGGRIPAGGPICTILAAGGTAAAAREALRGRAAAIRARLGDKGTGPWTSPSPPAAVRA